MYKYLFKEYNPEYDDTRSFFDDIYFSGSCDDNERIYILSYDRDVYGINKEEYDNVFENVNSLFNDFEYVKNNSDEYTYKQAMQENGLVYNPTMCSKLKNLYQKAYSRFYSGSYDVISEYLTITTGKAWKTLTIYGYCQGDMCTAIYCEHEHKAEQIKTYCNMFLGCYKAFYLADLDENGQEIEGTEVYGFYVADNQSWPEENIKKVLCDYEGLKPEEVKVLCISGQTTRTEYTYDET